jgi:hypothetical protein
MADFVIISHLRHAAVRDAIVRQYGENHYEFTPTSWFISDVGTTKDVMDKLGITNGKLEGAQAVIIKFDAYAGYGPAVAWKWLGQNSTAVSNG